MLTQPLIQSLHANSAARCDHILVRRLPSIRFVAVKSESSRKLPPRFAEAPEDTLTVRVTANLKLSFAHNGNLDVISSLQVQSLNH